MSLCVREYAVLHPVLSRLALEYNSLLIVASTAHSWHAPFFLCRRDFGSLTSDFSRFCEASVGWHSIIPLGYYRIVWALLRFSWGFCACCHVLF